MNITLCSDRPVVVTLRMTFTDLLVYEVTCDLAGKGNWTHCVVGRWPQDLVNLELEYDGARFAHPIEINGMDGKHLKEINIYGGRDKWSQLLRNKALEASNA